MSHQVHRQDPARPVSLLRDQRSIPRYAALLCLVALGCLVASTAARGQDPKADFFESKIRPVLVEKCYECHSAQASDVGGKLRLDGPAAMRQGGTMGPSIAVGSANDSLLIRAIEYNDSGLQMPPDGKLSDEQIAHFKQWINDGAVDPRPDVATSDPHPAVQDRARQVAEHWAYQPFSNEAPPDQVGTLDALSDPIDRWVALGLSEHGLELAPEASRRTLVRRLYYDLLGLPPTMDQIAEVERNAAPEWYAQLVDGLLQSPHFGERMARRWMDVMRYADNKGYVFVEDREYAHAYRYRDWLIRAFNEDMPYDQFVKYQLIGDRLDPKNERGNLDAMGMLTLGRRFLNNPHDIADDRIDVITRGLMGVTAACARCHDHKFDPVTMADYYSLHAALTGSDEPGGDPSPMRLVDRENQGPVRVFLRGSPGNPGPEVPRRFIAFLQPDAPVEMKTGSGRLEMADAIASPSNPLTSRVMVNRIWGWIAGVPLVDTPSDFGLRCEAPAQRRLLDTLARDWVQDQWSVKRLIRRIVMSRVYRQKSDHRPDAYALDPENRWLWRAERKRMDFESLRDALLAASGQLDRNVGGPSVKIAEPPFSKRRTLYAYIDRQNLPQLFRSFDFASPDAHVPMRPQTTVPQQGLVLMNSDLLQSMLPSVGQQSAAIAAERGPDAAIEYLFKQVLARDCTTQEREWFREFVSSERPTLPNVPENQWSYGVAAYAPESGSVTEFRWLPRFHEGRWQGRKDTLPDDEFNWCLLSATGGHPGPDAKWSVVRRWTAMEAMQVRIRGSLSHKQEAGDGVRGAIIVRGQQKLGEWTVKNSSADTHVDEVAVEAGDTIDFVTDCIGGNDSDTFEWKVRLVSRDESRYRCQSERHFSGSQPVAISVWEEAAQALLLTNEFCFID